MTAEISSSPAEVTQLPNSAGSCMRPVLLDPRTAALNQHDQNDNKEYTGNNLDNRGTVHNNFPFSFSTTCFSVPNGEPNAEETRSQSRKVLYPQDCGDRQIAHTSHGATGSSAKTMLLDLRAAALNQNDQNYDKEHTGNNLDNRGTVHPDSSLFQPAKISTCKRRLERIDHHDDRRPKDNDKERGEDKENQGKDQLDRGLRRRFLHLLHALRPEGI
jgi:hypothetical protein